MCVLSWHRREVPMLPKQQLDCSRSKPHVRVAQYGLGTELFFAYTLRLPVSIVRVPERHGTTTAGRSYSPHPKLVQVISTISSGSEFIIAVRSRHVWLFSISVKILRVRKALPDSAFVFRVQQVRLSAPDSVYRCVEDDSTEGMKRRGSCSPVFYLSSFSDL